MQYISKFIKWTTLQAVSYACHINHHRKKEEWEHKPLIKFKAQLPKMYTVKNLILTWSAIHTRRATMASFYYNLTALITTSYLFIHSLSSLSLMANCENPQNFFLIYSKHESERNFFIMHTQKKVANGNRNLIKRLSHTGSIYWHKHDEWKFREK